MQTLTGCIFTGGEGPPARSCRLYAEEAAIIVAADSGLLLARAAGIRPDYIIGDMDSLPDTGILAEYDAARVIRFPREKDYTDTELALNLLREKGCARSILVGGGGGRLDHLLAVYSLFHRSSPPSVWVTDKYEVVYIKEKYRLTARPGEEVSFFPVGEGSVRMKSRGLKWPLDSLEWRTGDAGVSNIVTEAPAEIEVLSGAVILLSALSALPQGGLLS